MASGRAMVLLERGAGVAAVLAASDQARAAVSQLQVAEGHASVFGELLGRLLVEVDHCRHERVAGSAQLEAALGLVRLAWFTPGSSANVSR